YWARLSCRQRSRERRRSRAGAKVWDRQACRWPRTCCRPSHPPLHGGWEIFLLPGGQDLELPPHQPQDHPGPLRFPETPKDLAVRAAITPPFPPSALRPAR
ncbi:hypothetical protein NDU88_003944, partial [Pleurodeles waltl]